MQLCCILVVYCTLSVFGVGKREPSYSTEGIYSITEHHRLRFSERLTPVLTMGSMGHWTCFSKTSKLHSSRGLEAGPVQVFG